MIATQADVRPWLKPEAHNLGLEPEQNRETILRMNALLNDMIAKEVGANNGRFLTQIMERKGTSHGPKRD